MTENRTAVRVADKEGRRLQALTAELRLPLSGPASAVLRLAPGSGAAAGDWLQLSGTGEGCYRVRKTETDCVTGIQTAWLRHGLDILGDTVLPQEAGTLEGPFETVLRGVLDYARPQTDEEVYWQAGEVAIADTVAVSAGGEDALSLLVRLMEDYPDFFLEADQRQSPWTLNVRRCPEGPEAEGRLSRNLCAAGVVYDTSRVCTRVLSELLPGGRMDGEAKERFGIVSREVPFPDGAAPGTIEAAARRYLESHAEPELTVTLDALELSELTGEEADRFLPGRRMRVCVPELGMAVEERIMQVRYPDAVGEPERAEVTLSNRVCGPAKSLDRLERETFAALRKSEGAQRRAKENEKRISRNAQQIRLKAEKSEMDDTRQRMSAAGIVIDGPAAQVKLLASQTTVDTLTQRVARAEASVAVNAESIEMKVSRDGVISAINQTAEKIRIEAGRIELSGYATAEALDAAFTGGRNMVAEDLEITGRLYVQDEGITLGAAWKSVEVVTGITPSYTAVQNWALTDAAESGITGHFRGRFVNGVTPHTQTLYYLGR